MRKSISTWCYSTHQEALRLIHAAHNVANGFYKNNGFLILPDTFPSPPDSTVLLPDLPFLSIPRFWQKAAQVDISTTPMVEINTPPSFIRSVTHLLSSQTPPTINFKSTQTIWTKYEAQILSQIYSLIPSQRNSIRTITIWPTHYGTGCSFSLPNKPPHHIQIWLRNGYSAAYIIEAVLSSLTRPGVYSQLDGMWSESEAIVDWLMTFSPLARLVRKIDPLWTPTIKSTRQKQSAHLFQLSQNFLSRLGAPSVSMSQVDISIFSPREKQVFNLLLSKSPQPTSFDEIGDLLFANNPNAYSLEAIAKTIQRLRDKLELNGISGSFIQTKRGEGYLLIN